MQAAGDKLKAKLARVGLVDAPTNLVLSDFLRDYILSRPDVKSATLEVWQQPCSNLIEFSVPTSRYAASPPAMRNNSKLWLLTQSLSPATVAKRLSFCRTFFHTARKHRFIDTNPFAEVSIPMADVKARQRFIDRDAVQRLLEVANPT